MFSSDIFSAGGARAPPKRSARGGLFVGAVGAWAPPAEKVSGESTYPETHISPPPSLLRLQLHLLAQLLLLQLLRRLRLLQLHLLAQLLRLQLLRWLRLLRLLRQ